MIDDILGNSDPDLNADISKLRSDNIFGSSIESGESVFSSTIDDLALVTPTLSDDLLGLHGMNELWLLPNSPCYYIGQNETEYLQSDSREETEGIATEESQIVINTIGVDNLINIPHIDGLEHVNYEVNQVDPQELGHFWDTPSSNISFKGNLGNMYDRNAIDFIKDCHKHNINLPSSIDHCNLKSETVIDRCTDGGFKSGDKIIIRNTLNEYHDSGKLSDADYNRLISKLNKC